MTLEELNEAGIPASDELLGNAGLWWIKTNTSLQVDITDSTSVATLPAGAKAFVVKFCEVMGKSGGVASESIGGMSQSFVQDNALSLWQYANALIGAENITGGLATATYKPATEGFF